MDLQFCCKTPRGAHQVYYHIISRKHLLQTLFSCIKHSIRLDLLGSNGGNGGGICNNIMSI